MGERWRAAVPSILSVALALVVCWLLIAIMLGSRMKACEELSGLPAQIRCTAVEGLPIATKAYREMLYGGLGQWDRYQETGNVALLARPLGESAGKAALLILTGLAVAVAFKAGLFNIGAQGQMVVGSLAAAVVGAQLSMPSVVHIPLAILAAAVAGAAWALIAAALKLWRGVHEVISTIMLNWVAVSLVDNWLSVGPLRAVASGGHSVAGTAEILPSAQFPRLLGDISRLNLGFPVALAVAVLVWVWLTRTQRGFETRAAGLGPEAAKAAGISVKQRAAEAMALSGALAGMAGAVLVLGTEFRYPGSLGAPYGFDGIAIALIGNNNPLGATVTALFFGILRAGGTRMQLLGVHKSFPELIQGLALLFVAGRLIWLALLRRRRVQVVSTEVPRA